MPRRFFSARWTGVWYVDAGPGDGGEYVVYLGADDWARLTIDGQVIAARGRAVGYGTVAVPVRLYDGPHTIVIQYGQLGLKRTIHMNMKQHPAKITPTRAGHSIGRWENDVLIVDTIGFLPGVLEAPVRHSDKLHVVERFQLDPKTNRLTRSYTAEDPVYLKGQGSGSDVVEVADAPYAPDNCNDKGRIDYSKQVSGAK